MILLSTKRYCGTSHPWWVQAVGCAKSLEGVIAAHETFLEGASRAAFTAPQQTSKLLRAAISRLLSLIGEFAVSGLSSKVSDSNFLPSPACLHL